MIAKNDTDMCGSAYALNSHVNSLVINAAK